MFGITIVTIKNTRLKLTQFRIHNKIIVFNWFYQKINIKESNCVFCECESETVCHLLYDCIYVQVR